jgi:hypothetical protein
MEFRDKIASIKEIPITDNMRAIAGFCVGLLIMLQVVHIFHVNTFDFDNMQRGVRLITSGVNPWAPDTRIYHYYNPPFAILFLWPMLFTTPKFFLLAGGALLFSFLFYHKAWVAFAWFFTNTFLWLVGAGGIDMLVTGAGLMLLIVAEKSWGKWHSLFWRVLAYGVMMIKPQGGILIVGLFILSRRDWKGLLISLLIYSIPFLSLYPDWFNVLINDPPLAQTVASHTIMAKFGFLVAIVLASLVTLSRKWKYWQIGGALSGILMPYGMPGLPIFLTLTSVNNLKAIPVIIGFSGLLASLTWINIPEGLNDPEYLSHLMSIYHLGMLGLALILAALSGKVENQETKPTSENSLSALHSS